MLIVEDDPDLARVLTEMLASSGYAIGWAASAEQAADVLQTTRARLIVLDLTLPGADGFAFAEWFRGREGAAQTPVVVYTALDLTTAEQGRLRAQGAEIHTKSRIAPEQFERHVLGLLRQIAPAADT